VSLDDVAAAARLVELAGRLEHCSVDGYTADFVSWGFYQPSIWRNYWHTHSFYEVCLAYRGEGVFQVGEDEFDVGAGSVFVARPGDLHQIIGSASAPLGIAFWGFGLAPGRGANPSKPGWWSGLVRGDRPLVSDRLGRLTRVLSDLAAELEQPRSGQQQTLRSLGAMLVMETGRAFADDADLAIESPPEDRRTVLVATMERYLLDNQSRPISVRDVAAEVHLSERHAERLYAAQSGQSLMAALRRIRLERAAGLLLDSEHSVTEIARDCGYPQVRPFITAFGRRYGQSPRAFRRNGGTLHLS
jgi:AraC-like DNA-binding protein